MKIIKAAKKYLVFNKNLDYKKYWNKRYQEGGNSGKGSYGELFEYKTNYINEFIETNNIKSLIDFGCGDGNQIKSLAPIKYLGFDVAMSSINICRNSYNDDENKSFMLYDPNYFSNNNFIGSELVISLDVLYHIIDEEDFIKTINDIFSCSNKFVILFTSFDRFTDEPYKAGTHVRHRDTLRYLKNIDGFEIVKIEPKFDVNISSASFIIMKKISN
ncbi:MAG: hypothetical protein UT48_C0012G0023 [Parcubacteria group bacterium GW2011_GWE2_39_37]|nr:MAG: hypothetical protein UT48_C0012G0023 [Parcubacteria group bacterium GW2011_GWE2_39_37]